MGRFLKCLDLLWVIALLLIKPYTSLGSRKLESESDGGIIMNPPPMGICKSAVTKHGYKCQEIDVTTEDGYILSVQRIPEGRGGGSGGGSKRPPVLLQHGVLVVILLVLYILRLLVSHKHSNIIPIMIAYMSTLPMCKGN